MKRKPAVHVAPGKNADVGAVKVWKTAQAMVGRNVPVSQVGSFTGLVGASGGLGGFLPPIVMGLVYQVTGSYSIGLMLLSNVAFAGAVYTAWRLRPS